MAPNHPKRLEAFKAGTAPYCQLPPRNDVAEKKAERDREIGDRIRAKIAEEKKLRAERNASVAAHKAFTRRLRKAARALPLVYGVPPGSPAVQASVRRAKSLYAGGMPALEALEQCPEDCALMEVVEAVLAMRGAGT